MPTAFLIDGGFFLRRFQQLRGRQSPEYVAEGLYRMCMAHLQPKSGKRRNLQRILYYDCPPLMKRAHHPITGKAVDFSKTATATWRLAFHEELRRRRKVALRLGYLNERMARWTVREKKMKAILSQKITVSDLDETDVTYEAKQMGVDMRIALDIASLAYKKQADQIVLVAGDSDFVPAAKLARREGIDFVLDPMWAKIRDDLHEHIDGLRTVIKRPSKDETDVDAS